MTPRSLLRSRCRKLSELKLAFDATRILAHLENPMSSEIKSLSAQLARVREAVKQRVGDVSAKLGAAETSFHRAADGTEGYVAQVAAYTAELQSMTAELTNGGPPLDDDFRATPERPASGREAVIAEMHALGREHNP